ncbi:MAG: methionyl-tRNA formyltransferase [Thermoanaerobaculia bacterium]
MEIVFFGTPEFAVPSLRTLLLSSHRVKLVVAQPDRPAGRGMKLRKPPVAEVALEAGVPLVQPAKIRDESFLSDIEKTAAEVAVVVAYGRILPASLLGIPRHGFVNVHASLLPRYRGAAPIQRAIAHGDRVTGVSIMKLDEEMDHGPVYATERTPIEFDERAPSVAARLAVLGGALLVDVLDEIERGTAVAKEQDHDAATYAPKVEKREGEVAWSDRALAIYDRFRAFDPWPGTFTIIRGESVRLVDITPVIPRQSLPPGTVLEVGASDLVVACSEGALRVRMAQRPGKKPAPAADLARGWSIAAGAMLG